SERLPRNDKVGLDAEVLDRPDGARPPDPRLHLVRDVEDAVLAAECAQSLEEVPRHRDEAAFALYGLEHDARDRRRVDISLEQVLERRDRLVRVHAAKRVWGDGAVDLRRERPEP